MAAYVSPRRVERDGFLVAYRGERMTDAEARRRGLLDEAEAVEEPETVGTAAVEDETEAVEDGASELASMTKAQLIAEAKARGVAVPKGATKAEIVSLVEEAE